MKAQHLFSFLYLSVFALFLTSCGTVRTLPEAEAKITGAVALSTLDVPEGQSLVYVIRPSIAGYAINMPVTINDVRMGSTHGKRFLYAFVTPGKHILRGMAENEHELTLTTKPGQTYFVKQKVKMGILYARNKMVLLEKTDGIKKITGCKLPDNNCETTGFESMAVK